MVKLNEKQIQVIKDSSKLLDIGYDREIKDNSIEESLLIDLAEDLNSTKKTTIAIIVFAGFMCLLHLFKLIRF